MIVNILQSNKRKARYISPSKGGDSPRSIFTLKFESHIYLIIN